MDLGFLSHLYAVSGPYATVYLDTTRGTANAAAQIDLRWRGLRGELAAEGADEETLAAIDGVVGADGARGDGQVVVAAQGRVLLDSALAQAPRREGAAWSALPNVMPLVAQTSDVVPYVLVVADRTGADVTAFGSHGEELSTEVEGTGGPHLTKVNPGGWSQKRFQQRAENLWEANAGETARWVSGIAQEIGARLVIGAGDVRAVTFLRDHLEPPAREIFLAIDEGGRGAGASEESLERRVAQLVAEAAAHDALAIIEKFEEERGQGDRAVQGLRATVEAVRRAQVETLVLVDDPSSTALLYVGPDPVHLAVEADELADLGVTGAQPVRADAALVRALAATAADVVVAPAPLTVTDGVGAVLRYADAATPA